MYRIEEEGRTYEEAVQKALDKLGVSKERVTVELLKAKKKRLFGLLKNIRVRVTLNEVINEEGKKEKAEELLNRILNPMNLDYQIDNIRESNEKIFIDLNSCEESIIIGKQGRTINSVQHLLNLIYNKEHPIKKRIILNVGKYRKNREDVLKNLAKHYAERIKETNKDILLEPMSSEDRKIIHMALDKYDYIRTYSKGAGEYRSIIISPINTEKTIKNSNIDNDNNI